MNRLLVALCVVVAVGCGHTVDPNAREGAPFDVGGGPSGDGTGGSVPGTAAGDPGSSSGVGTGTGTGQVTPGILTAGAWDDNQNFDWFTRYRDSLGQTAGMPTFTSTEQGSAHEDAQTRAGKRALDVAFVIDTTGSMGDELSYLQTEFEAISQKIHEQFPNAAQRWALIAYRDEGDAYVLHGADFGTSVSWFQDQLGQLSAGGGGDFPEAPDQALNWAAANLSWNPDPQVAHLVFWVADAPPHAENAGKLSDALRRLRDEKVHVYPVASSGIDEVTEYTMRAAAQITSGRYLFLTDDSGIGDGHKTPTLPCYAVTKLDAAMMRVVASELSGTRVEANTQDILRTVGDPHEGRCELQEGEAFLF